MRFRADVGVRRASTAGRARRAVFAVRDGGDGGAHAGLAELIVSGLPEADARALLETVAPGPVDERVRARIMAETRGNPLALTELPRGLAPEQLAGGFGLPDSMP